MKPITDGVSYESWCAEYLKKQGYKEIRLTKASGDQGIDILARKGRTTYGIQCKFYTSPVGNSAVQEAYSGAAFYDCDQAAVMTNTTFTKGARELAEETDVELWENIVPYDLHQGKIRRCVSLGTMLAGMLLFLFCVLQPSLPHRITAVITSLASISGSLLRLYERRETGRIFLSLLCDLGCALLLYRLELPYHLSIPACLLMGLLSLVTLFQLLLSLKERNRTRGRALQQELQAEIEEETEELGKHLASVLSEEAGMKITLEEAQHSEGVSLFTFRSSGRIREDLALLEYSFNQTQKGSHSPYRCSIGSVSSNVFTFTLRKEDQD